MNEHAVLILGELNAATRAAVEQAHREASLEPVFVANVDQAVAALDGKPWRALLTDLTAPGASRFCHEARGRRALFNVPLIGMSPKLTDLAFLNALRWGADDLVALGAAEPLRTRLSATPYRVSPVANASRGDAIVADPDQGRCDLLGRVLSNAGYNVKYALDAVTLRFFALKTAPELVVLNADMLEARKLIEETRAAGKRNRWLVMARQKDVDQLSHELSRMTSVAVMSSHGPPENVLFYGNLLSTAAEGRRRSDIRALHGAMVLFRSVGDERDECGFTYSVSAGGLYIRTLLPPPAREVWLEITPAGQSRRVRLAGKVAWSRTFGQPGAETAPPGFGLRIVDGLGEDLALWEAGFRSLSPQGPESARTPDLPAGSFRVPSPAGVVPRPSLSTPSAALLGDVLPNGQVPSLPGRNGPRPSMPVSLTSASLRANLRPNSIAPMPVLTSQPPAWTPVEPSVAKPVAERTNRPPSPTSNDDRGRTVMGMGIPSDIRGMAGPTPANSGMQATDLAKLLADAGLLDTPSPEPVVAKPESEAPSEGDRRTVSLSPGDLESLPPGADSARSAENAQADADSEDGSNADGAPGSGSGEFRDDEKTANATVAEVLERLFDPSAGGSNSSVQIQDVATTAGAPAHTATDVQGLNLEAEAIAAASSPTLAQRKNSATTPATRAVITESTPAPKKRPRAAAAAGLAIAALVGTGVLVSRANQPNHKRTEPPSEHSFAAEPAQVAPAAPNANGAPVTTPSSLAPVALVSATLAPAAEATVETAIASEPSGAVDTQAPAALSAAPVGAASAEAVVAPNVAPVGSSAAPPSPPDVEQLPEDTAYLFVSSPLRDALVFVHGVQYGTTNQWLRTKCGLRFVRLGSAPGQWLSPGLPSRLRCRATNFIELTPQ